MSMIQIHPVPAAVFLPSSTTKSCSILHLRRSPFHVQNTQFKWHSNRRFIPCAATGFGSKSISKKTSPGFGAKDQSLSCPCGGGGTHGPYEDCCARYHGGLVEPDAVTLMKARYSAFALSQVPYLVCTTHPENADRAEGDQSLRDSISATCKCTHFKGLQIVSADPGDSPEVAFVSFRAKYTFKNDKEERVLVESSRFVKEGKRWFYREQIVDDPKSKRKWNLGAALYKEPSEEEKFANKMVTKGKPGVAFRKP